MTLLDLKPKTIYRVPRFAYLGAGAKVDELPRWLKFLERYDFHTYVDLTAGSNNQPYAVQRYFQRNVIVNDVCYYSHLIARAVLTRFDPIPFRSVEQAIGFARSNKRPGRFSANEEWDCGPHTKAMKLFIDGIAHVCSHQHRPAMHGPVRNAPLILAAVGSAILKKLTMRSTGQHSIRGKQPDGTVATVETLVDEIWRKVRECNPCVARLGSQNQVLFGTLLDALPKIDALDPMRPYDHSLKGCVVNVDYAWPYEKNDNPYYDYLDVSDFLGSPLDRKSFAYWKDETTENVLKEVTHMTREILKRNPVRFFLWNQTTNRPSPEVVLEHLAKQPGIQVQECFRVQRMTTSRKTTFDDVVLELRGLR